MALKDQLHWRYATKSYNGEKVEPQKIGSILEAIRMAPSSSGLQPFKVLVISNDELKARLLPICANQQQITQSSHLLVFAAWDEYTPERVNDFFEYSNGIRNLPASVTDDYRLSLLDSFGAMSEEQQYFHASKQCYIALGFALLAAADIHVDATPMEGFDNKAVDALLNLPEQGLRSSVLLTLGYRDIDSDWLVKLEKVRRAKQHLFEEIV
ncbi:nitroreductase family protein [Pseudomonas sp. PA27(2017)]|uniref:nitroreductase family protein n=1 Tax=Pseudomonas sp. PA27(2017) TaxID=1932112 RepID=UPI000960F42E|nr:nitroreductase family protein [Pseudomonas sp. PA27(2017)]OLU24050.1 NAD(P)H-dependent oxidoreductase [Pseudomonas sp. PA27(2017)]